MEKMLISEMSKRQRGRKTLFRITRLGFLTIITKMKSKRKNLTLIKGMINLKRKMILKT